MKKQSQTPLLQRIARRLRGERFMKIYRTWYRKKQFASNGPRKMPRSVNPQAARTRDFKYSFGLYR